MLAGFISWIINILASSHILRTRFLYLFAGPLAAFIEYTKK